MKKWLCIIIGLLVVAATVEAACGSCGTTAAKAKDKAACNLTAGQDQAACALKKAKCGADCKKPCCAAKAKGDKAMAKGKCCGTCKGKASAKKWYNPVSWFK